MTKLEFINALGFALSELPQEEIRTILDYYVEIIDDRMEDGMTEAEAIESLGPIPDLAQKILSEQEPRVVSPTPEEPIRRRLPIWAIVLLVLGCPLWLGLGAGLLGAGIGIYVAIWAVLGSLFVAAVSMFLAGIVCAILVFIVSVIPGFFSVRILGFGGSLVCAGIGLVLLPLSLWLIRCFARFHRWVFRRIFRRKGAV